MDLPDRRGGERRLLELDEEPFDRLVELFLDRALDVGEREGTDVVLEAAQLGNDVWRDDVGPSVRSLTAIEVDAHREARELDGGDLRPDRPAAGIGRVVPELGGPDVESLHDERGRRRVRRGDVVAAVDRARAPEVRRARNESADRGGDRRLRARLLGRLPSEKDGAEGVACGDVYFVNDRTGRARPRDIVDGERQRREPRGAVDRRRQRRRAEDHLWPDRERLHD